jgi:hypothetical protein
MIAFYYIFRFLAKLFLPLLVKKVVEKQVKICKSSNNNRRCFLEKDTNQG